MVKYVSTLGGSPPTPFDEVVLNGFAPDGGLYVPENIPTLSLEHLSQWSDLSFSDLAFEILSLFIDRTIIPAADLKRLIDVSYNSFESTNVAELVSISSDDRVSVMELFHGPTLSFKDIAMGFLMNVLDYLLDKRGEHLSIVLATTGDTGPAAAWAAMGKSTLDCWPLFPMGMITDEQQRQMTTLNASNVHPVGVTDCADGGDDLDRSVARLFNDNELNRKLNLSSVNSINWCRVMVQSVHYFYGYFRTVEKVGDRVAFSVPSGAFGNLFGGYLARSMGLPVHEFICANNANDALHSVLATGVLAKKPLIQTLSTAIDIVVPYNFWRYLYFATGGDSKRLKGWMDQFQDTGQLVLEEDAFQSISAGYSSVSVSDHETMQTIRNTFDMADGYMLDPHSAVAVAAALEQKDALPESTKIICLATAHPAKFPDIIRTCLGCGPELPGQATHPTLENARQVCEHLRTCRLEDLEYALPLAMTSFLSESYNTT